MTGWRMVATGQALARGSLMSVSEVCWRSMREVVAEMAAQYYASVASASNRINNNIINMKVSAEDVRAQEDERLPLRSTSKMI